MKTEDKAFFEVIDKLSANSLVPPSLAIARIIFDAGRRSVKKPKREK
jgi:hypothetical protein